MNQSGFTIERQPVGKLVQQSFGEAPRVKLSKPTQSKPNPICDQSGKPEDTERVFVDKEKTSRSHEICSSERSVKPEKLSEDIRVKHPHDGTGEPVKSSASTHIVKNNLFLQNIVTLHRRQALQSDLQQHRPFNPFSKESQDVIKAAGNTELCEILDVD